MVFKCLFAVGDFRVLYLRMIRNLSSDAEAAVLVESSHASFCGIAASGLERAASQSRFQAAIDLRMLSHCLIHNECQAERKGFLQTYSRHSRRRGWESIESFDQKMRRLCCLRRMTRYEETLGILTGRRNLALQKVPNIICRHLISYQDRTMGNRKTKLIDYLVRATSRWL